MPGPLSASITPPEGPSPGDATITVSGGTPPYTLHLAHDAPSGAVLHEDETDPQAWTLEVPNGLENAATVPCYAMDATGATVDVGYVVNNGPQQPE